MKWQIEDVHPGSYDVKPNYRALWSLPGGGTAGLSPCRIRSEA